MVSRRPPLKAIWERMTPARTKPQRVATRWEPALSGAHVSSIPASPYVVPTSQAAGRRLRQPPQPREAGRVLPCSIPRKGWEIGRRTGGTPFKSHR
jgi:hypothetical protein